MSAPDLLLKTERYTEGVVVATDGTLFFSITSQGVIMTLRPNADGAEIWAHLPAANGHAIDDDGTHIVMSSAGSIVRLDANGRMIRVVATQIAGRWLVYPNDIVRDTRRGGYYITDSGYKTMPKRTPDDPQGRVYRIGADGTPSLAATGIAYANGIALSIDGTQLFVGESVTGRILRYPVAADGALGEHSLFAQMPADSNEPTAPDGCTVGPDGRLFVAHYGAREVVVYDTDGTLSERVPAGNKAASHAAFAPDNQTLYVSGGLEDESGAGAIFAIRR